MGSPKNELGFYSMNQSNRDNLSSAGAGYVSKEGVVTPRGLYSNRKDIYL